MDVCIDLDKIPLSAALSRMCRTAPHEFMHCLNGGDDYEILAGIPVDHADEFTRKAAACGCRVSCIGQVREGAGKVAALRGGAPVDLSKVAGFRHF